MTKDERMKIYVALSAPFAEETIERTDGRTTGRGYSTTGIRAQYIINRLNEVLGVGGFRVERTISVRQIATSKGRDAFEAACEIRLQLGAWQDGSFIPFAEAVADGGHTAMTDADARKGAASNGFKKAAAMFGCGRQAYEGTLDDDNPDADQAIPFRVSKCATDLLDANLLEGGETASAKPASSSSGGRVSSAQLAKLRDLVEQQGVSWPEFRASVREQHRINVEYASKALASELISDLIARGRTRKLNGSPERSAQ